MIPGEISVGFTCRVKVESVSAPYGSTETNAGGSGQGGERAMVVIKHSWVDTRKKMKNTGQKRNVEYNGDKWKTK